MYLPLLFLLVSWLPGCCTAEWAISGPGTASGREQGSLTVQCRYASQWKTYVKWWCRGADWSSCRMLVKTSNSEPEVKKDRVSIMDDQINLTLTVTMKDLRMSDADMYWCGIERIGLDHGVRVHVTIDPAPSTVSTTVPTTTTTTTFTAPTSVEETSVFTTLTSVGGRHRVTELSILLPVVFAALLLLLAAASLLAWMIMKQKKKGGNSQPVSPSLQPQEDELCYANLSLQQPGANPSSAPPRTSVKPSSAQAGQAEVDYVVMAPFPRTEISYASLSLDALHREPTYCNTPAPGTGHEETTQYSSIRRP
ncbi:CMRF35-like molecule 1 [Perognathus longimembris pacificus]|uniref:CMRF35-like molecule 1 n=1 Tax=Perognathus longimembris pacificus TaxID=214514 RepID=UPI0020196BF1|nr:CMRF35-like molecule 1 [Perognathus longimembris pacificus]